MFLGTPGRLHAFHIKKLYTNINLYFRRSIYLGKLLLILSLIQCDKVLSLYIIIFYWFYIFQTVFS